MKSLQDYILESKNDNLHEFIQYLNKSGKRGQLKSKYKKEDIYSEFIADIDIRKKKEINDIPFNKLLSKLDWWYMDEKELAFRKSIKNNDFADWYADWATPDILKYIVMNNHNCVYIERAIAIPKFSDKDDLYKEFKKEYNGHLGVYWSYTENGAVVYDSPGEDYDIVILKGYVQPENVNWRETIVTGLYYDNEFELRLLKDSPIQLTEIFTEKGNHKVFTGNLLLKA